jgi:hypothetical protein
MKLEGQVTLYMKKTVQPLSNEYLAKYPIRDLVDGWFFRIQEVSNGVYEVEGTDIWGRKVLRTSSDTELNEALKACANDARKIQAELDKK